MVTIGISEFTFGYAFLHEQTTNHAYNLRAAPILPSLQEEHNFGWDARLPLIGMDYYYQFKLSDHLIRPNAKFIKDGTYHDSYYRIALHRHNSNRQHQRLKELSGTNPNTFYITPEFNTLDEFNAAFLNNQIVSQSRLIPLNECDEITDSEQHYITFQQGQEEWILHSEKKIYKKSMFGKNIFTVYEESRPNWRPLDNKYSINLFNNISKTVFTVIDKEERTPEKKKMKLLEFDPQQSTKSQTLLQTSQVLSIFFGVILVLVGTRELNNNQ
jgi:hypothetical protein